MGFGLPVLDFALWYASMLNELKIIISAALAEDIGRGDITSELTIPAGAQAEMKLVARQEMVVCGMDVPNSVFSYLMPSPAVAEPLLPSPVYGRGLGRGEGIQHHVSDGDLVKAGTVLVTLKGNARMLLAGERTVLNIMQRMSGVATLTRKYVDAVKGTKAIILDTRKTMPGLRVLDKYATKCGGAENHRMRLDDMVLIKDNHIAMGNRESGIGIREIVENARKKITALDPKPQSPIPIVVECDTLVQVQEALAAKPDRILLDNMDNAMLREAVKLAAGKTPLEASGNVSLETVRGIAETGVDYISVGKLTHSAPAVDIGADVVIHQLLP